MTHLLLDDNDILIVNKQLACAVGLNNSIVLRQLHYWLCLNQKAKSEKHFRDGCWWSFNTYDEWTLENFPFWSKDTVRRALLELTDVYGIVETGNYNERHGDQTKWYTINYARYDAFISLWIDNGSVSASERETYKAFLPIWQLAKGNIATCKGQDGKLHRPLPETSTETNTIEIVPVVTTEPVRPKRKADPEYDVIGEVWKTTASGWIVNMQGMMFGTKRVKGEWLDCQFSPPATVDEVREFGVYARKRDKEGNLPTKPPTIQRWFYDFRTEKTKPTPSVLDGLRLVS